MATPYPSGPAAGSQEPRSRVELHISCKDLIDADLFSKSDPIVSVFTRASRGKSGTWIEVEQCQIMWI